MSKNTKQLTKSKLILLETNSNMDFVRLDVPDHRLVFQGRTRNIFWVIAVFRFFLVDWKLTGGLKAKRMLIKVDRTPFGKLEVLINRCHHVSEFG